MKKYKKSSHHNRLVAVIALAVAVLGLGVAFAALSTTLNINGTAKVERAEWEVYWSDLSCTASGYAGFDTNTFSPDGYMLDTDINSYDTANVAGLFKAPGDKIVCELDAENDGTIDAKISGLSSRLSELSTDNISATLTYYSTTTAPKDGDVLVAGDTAYYVLTLTYNGNTVSSTDKAVRNFSFTLPYVQKN